MRTSSKKCSLGPIHSQHDTGAQADTLSKVDTAPKVDRQKAAAEIETAKIEHCRVSDIGEATEMSVLKCLVDSLVKVTVVDLVGSHARKCGSDLVEFLSKILALLISALCGSRKGGQLGVNLAEKFM